MPAFLIVTALGAVGVTLFAVLEPRGPHLSSTSGPVSPPPIAAPPVHVTGEPLLEGDLSLVLETLAWPAVAIVAIVALFLISRQAIAGGRNVEISWKVTEKVAGRLVITKVRSRIPRSEAV